MATRGDREYAEIMGTGFPKWKVGDVIKMKPARGPAGMTGKIIKVISPPQESIYLTRYKIDGELGDWLKKHTEDPTGFDILAANSRACNDILGRYKPGARVSVEIRTRPIIGKVIQYGGRPIVEYSPTTRTRFTGTLIKQNGNKWDIKSDSGEIYKDVSEADLGLIYNSRAAKNDADPYLSEKLKLMIRQGAVSEVAGGKPMPGDVVFEYRGKRYYTDKDSAHMVKQFSDAGLVKMHNSCGVRSTNAEARNTALPIGTIGVSDSTILWRMIDGGRDEPYHDEYQKRLDRMNQRDIPEDTVAILKKYGYRFKNAQNCGVRSTIPAVNAALCANAVKPGDIVKVEWEYDADKKGLVGMTGEVLKISSGIATVAIREKGNREYIVAGHALRKIANTRVCNEYGTRYIDEGDRVFVVSKKKKGIVKSFKTVKGPQPIISVKYDDGSIGVVDANDLRVIPNSSSRNAEPSAQLRKAYDEWKKAKNSAARNAKVKGIGPIQTEDDIVAVYDPKGNQVYKGEWDYCDLKDSDSTYDPSTKTYKILSPSFYKGYLLAKIG